MCSVRIRPGKNEEVANSTAHNRISSVNVTLAALRGDDRINVKPSDHLAPLSQIRARPITGLDREHLQEAVAALRAAGLERSAAVAELARETGMRVREAIMQNQNRLQREAAAGKIDIREGTKGGRGRRVERLVSVTDTARTALDRARAIMPPGSR